MEASANEDANEDGMEASANEDANEDGMEASQCERRQRRCLKCEGDRTCWRQRRCKKWMAKQCLSLVQTAFADRAVADTAVADNANEDANEDGMEASANEDANEDGMEASQCERRQRRCLKCEGDR